MLEFDDLKAIRRKLEAILGEQLFWAQNLERLDTIVVNNDHRRHSEKFDTYKYFNL